jgi:asparagine synthase (glutamine-hydrolysing)
MCGIAGFFGQFPSGVLYGMSDAIRHRGPDDDGVYSDPATGVGLVHRRLSIIDLSPAGHQPMWDVRRQAVIVFNGEIYNYRELAADLAKDGYTFAGTSDTEVILNLYLRDGHTFLRKLNGIFAFAIWDVRNRSMLVARDGMGTKPLYYSVSRSGFCFASEIKALGAVSDIDRKLDTVALTHYLTYLYCPAPRTLFRGVKKMLPGEAMQVGRDGIERRWMFYRQPYSEPIHTGLSVEEGCRQLVEHLSTAVRRQMVADVPVGAFLSGGLDSSSIAMLARQYAREGELHCFTVDFNGGSTAKEGLAEDLPYAIRVAKHLGVNLSRVSLKSGMTDGLEKMIWHLDEPQADPAALNTFFISQAARENGMKVLLSGAGGDDIFTGYRRHYALLQERWWGWMPRTGRVALRMASCIPSKRTAAGRRVAKAFQNADDTPQRRLAGYFVWLRREHVMRLLSPEVRAEVEQHDPLEPMMAALAELPANTPAINQMLFLDAKFFLTDHNLNYTDKLSMAAGVEVRVPFLDPDLMRFAAGLPVDFKQRGAVGKWIFKRAMEPYLPKDVIYRPKTGFGAPLREWMDVQLRNAGGDALMQSPLCRMGIFDIEGVHRLVRLHQSGEVDATYPIFEIMCIDTWLRLFRPTL